MPDTKLGYKDMKNQFKFMFIICALLSALVLNSCAPEYKLEFAIGAASAECPIDLGDGITITNIDSEDNNVVYTCIVDESDSETLVSDMDNHRIRSVMKESILSTLVNSSDPDMNEFINLVKEAKYNIVYRYIGSLSNTKVDIVIYPHEL